MKDPLKPIVLVLFIAAMLLVLTLLPVREWLSTAALWTESHRRVAWLLFLAAYTLATVLVVPGTILSLAAGFAFGLPVGVLLVSAGSLAGAGAAFLVGRFFARDWVARRVAGLRTFAALDKATRQDGFLIVFLTRLSPLFPFNLLNYAFGLTAVRFKDYLLASWIGMAPGILRHVYIGSAAQHLGELTDGRIEAGMGGRVLFIAGLVATLILTAVITRKVTRMLAQHLEGAAATGEVSSDEHRQGAG